MSKIRPIEDILDSISVTHKFDKDKLVFLNTSDVLEGKILIDDYMHVDDMKGQAKKTIKNGDILFSEIRPKNKRYAFVNVPNPEDYVVSTKLMVLRNKTKDVLTKYVYYFLTYEGTLNYLQMRAENRIGSFPQITYDILKELKVNVPETNIQQRIVDVISALDAKIELNQRINTELESMAKTLYDYWFVQFDFPNEKGKPYKSAGGKMVWSEELKREIPLGWSDGVISDFADVIDPHPSHRAPVEVKEGFPFAGIGDIDKEGNIDLSKARLINEDFVNKQEKDYEITNNSIGYGRVGTVGKVVKLRKQSFRYAISPTLSIINPKERYASFVYFTVNDKNFYNMVIRKMSGSTRPAVGIQELRRIPIIAIPEKHASILAKFELIASYCIKQADIINKESQTLTELRDWLLPMLMNGQVTIK